MTWTTTTSLYAHQQAAVNKIYRLRVGGLFMEMGTGKTRAAIELACLRQHRIDHVVWLCPVSLKRTIAAEWRKHTDLAADAIYVFDERTDETLLKQQQARVSIVGIESVSASNRVVLALNQLITNRSFVVLDESSYIKGPYAKRTERLTLMAARARYRLILTGTPLTQGVQDLFSQMKFLSPQILGYRSFYSFAANHLEYSEKYKGLVVRAHNTGILAAKLAPYTYQVTKNECLDLPAKLYDRYYFELTHAQRAAYWQAKEELLLSVPEDEITVYDIFRLFTALQQIVCGFWNHKTRGLLLFPHRRLETLDKIVRAIPTGKKIIVWAKYRYCVDAIAAVLAAEHGPVARWDGTLSERDRAVEIDRFRSGARFFVATPATGGHGLTLNEAHHVVFYTNEFKYANRAQAEDRCHRLGQTLPVTYVDIIAEQTIDERIQHAIAKKEDIFKSFQRKLDLIKDDKAPDMKKKIRTLIEEL